MQMNNDSISSSPPRHSLHPSLKTCTITCVSNLNKTNLCTMR
jgi:hypothetical protein